MDNDKVEGFVIKSNIKNIISIKLKEDNIKLNIFIDYKKDDIDILTLYTLKGLNNIPIKIFNYNNSVIKNAIVKSNYINIDIDLK